MAVRLTEEDHNYVGCSHKTHFLRFGKVVFEIVVSNFFIFTIWLPQLAYLLRLFKILTGVYIYTFALNYERYFCS